jgi:hypothetical protein
VNLRPNGLGSLEAWKLAPFFIHLEWSLVVGDAQVGGGGLGPLRGAVGLRRRCWGSSSPAASEGHATPQEQRVRAVGGGTSLVAQLIDSSRCPDLDTPMLP